MIDGFHELLVCIKGVFSVIDIQHLSEEDVYELPAFILITAEYLVQIFPDGFGLKNRDLASGNGFLSDGRPSGVQFIQIFIRYIVGCDRSLLTDDFQTLIDQIV